MPGNLRMVLLIGLTGIKQKQMKTNETKRNETKQKQQQQNYEAWTEVYKMERYRSINSFFCRN